MFRTMASQDLGKWLATRINAGDSWDAIVRNILTVEGEIKNQPQVIFFGLAGPGVLSTQFGAGFSPQLDKGDLPVEARRLPGAALTESVATDLRLQKALKKIPEVQQVVSKTGAPEVATDPMGVEQSDVFVGLKPMDQWRSGLIKEDISKEIAEAVEHAVPEIAGGVSQPIQMRTNELVAGVRSDVAILLYGPDLDVLTEYGDKIAATIRPIKGAEDVRVEQVAGLSYLRIIPDRAKLARIAPSLGGRGLSQSNYVGIMDILASCAIGGM